MRDIKFSVIVPVYNVEKYLVECMESILNQTYSAYEIICVEDVSTDKSADILREIACMNNRITILQNEQNGGLSFSRNRGLEIAKGEYVLFVDSDDYLEINALKILNSFLQDEEVDILHFNFSEEIESECVKEKKAFTAKEYATNLCIRTGQRWYMDRVFYKNLIPMAWNKVFRREFLLENDLWFYERLIHEDELFCIQSSLMAKRVKEIEDRLYVYRRRDGSISTIRSVARLDSLAVIMSEVMTLCEESPLEDGMSEALQHQMSVYMSALRVLMMYFPKHTQLSIGTEKDQLFFDQLRNSYKEIDFTYISINEEELDYMKSFEDIIVYGAGVIAAEMLQYATVKDILIREIAVTCKEHNEQQMAGHMIKQIDELLEYKDKALVIVALAQKTQGEVNHYLRKLGYKNIFLLRMKDK